MPGVQALQPSCKEPQGDRLLKPWVSCLLTSLNETFSLPSPKSQNLSDICKQVNHLDGIQFQFWCYCYKPTSVSFRGAWTTLLQDAWVLHSMTVPRELCTIETHDALSAQPEATGHAKIYALNLMSPPILQTSPLEAG